MTLYLFSDTSKSIVSSTIPDLQRPVYAWVIPIGNDTSDTSDGNFGFLSHY